MVFISSSGKGGMEGRKKEAEMEGIKYWTTYRSIQGKLPTGGSQDAPPDGEYLESSPP